MMRELSFGNIRVLKTKFFYHFQTTMKPLLLPVITFTSAVNSLLWRVNVPVFPLGWLCCDISQETMHVFQRQEV